MKIGHDVEAHEVAAEDAVAVMVNEEETENLVTRALHTRYMPYFIYSIYYSAYCREVIPKRVMVLATGAQPMMN